MLDAMAYNLQGHRIDYRKLVKCPLPRAKRVRIGRGKRAVMVDALHDCASRKSSIAGGI